MTDGVTTDEQLLSQARKLRREAHELERIGHALSLAAGRRRFLDDARELHARADRLEAQVRAVQERSTQVRETEERSTQATDAPSPARKVPDSTERS